MKTVRAVLVLALCVVLVGIGPLAVFTPRAQAVAPLALGAAVVTNPYFLAAAAVLVAGGLAVDNILHPDDSVVSHVANWFQGAEFANSRLRFLIERWVGLPDGVLKIGGTLGYLWLRDFINPAFSHALPSGFRMVGGPDAKVYLLGSVIPGGEVMRGTWGARPTTGLNPENWAPVGIEVWTWHPEYTSGLFGSFQLVSGMSLGSVNSAYAAAAGPVRYSFSRPADYGDGWTLVRAGDGGTLPDNVAFSTADIAVRWRYGTSGNYEMRYVTAEVVGAAVANFDRWDAAPLVHSGVVVPPNVGALRDSTQARVDDATAPIVGDLAGAVVIDAGDVVGLPNSETGEWEDQATELGALNLLGRVFVGVRDWVQGIGRTAVNVGTDVAVLVNSIVTLPQRLYALATTWVIDMVTPTIAVSAVVDEVVAELDGRFPLGTLIALSPCVTSMFAGGTAPLVITVPGAGIWADMSFTVPFDLPIVGTFRLLSGIAAWALLAIYVFGLGRRVLGLGGLGGSADDS